MNRLSRRVLFLRLLSLAILVLLALSSLAAGDVLLKRAAATAGGPQESAAGKLVHGRVQTADGSPVANALVSAHRVEHEERVESLSDADGFYELHLSAGLWAVTVELASDTSPRNWLCHDEAKRVEFQPDDSVESHELNFTVCPADAGVTGLVEMPDGSVPPFVVTVGLHNGEGQGGRTTIDPTSGYFKLELPHGRYDVVVHPHHDGHAGPHLEPVHLRPGQVVDLGTIILLARDARISGVVTDNHGEGVAGMPVTAWQRGWPHLLSTRTISNGHYSLAVPAGTWHVQPAPGPDMPYFYLGEGKTVRVGPGEVAGDVDFEVLKADAVIAGFMVTEDGERIHDVSGWATAVNVAEPEIQSGAPIREGAFRIHVTRGDYLVSAELPPGSPYFPLDPVPASVKSGETITVSIPLQKKDAVIGGYLFDPRQDRRPVTGVHGVVSARNGDRWAMTHIRPDTGTYQMGVTAGVWRLNYRIDNAVQLAADLAGQPVPERHEYVKLGGPQNIPVQSGQKVEVPLPVTRKDALISGRVLAPDGEPLPGAMVIAQGLSGDIRGLRLRTQSDDHGNFRLRLPHGRYRVGATGGEPGWINPVEHVVAVAPNTDAAGIVLRFHEPNAAVGGTLTVLNTDAEGEVLVWAWSERGGFTYGRFPVAQSDPGGQASGLYHLGVISGTTWHLGAVFETDDELWLGRGAVKVESNVTSLDLDLSGPFPKPPPVVVTFDAGQAQRLTLADGTKIFVPAGAMPVEGLVTLRIVPLASLPHQRHAHVVKYGYAIFATDESGRPIEERFTHNVVIRFNYDEVDLAGWEHTLKPAYFSTTTNEWTFPESYTIRPDLNLVTMEIDHFTNFALVEGQAPEAVFVPLLMR
jgi:hypothetical protein